MKISAFNLIRGAVFTTGADPIPVVVASQHLNGDLEVVFVAGRRDGQPFHGMFTYMDEVELIGLSQNPDDIDDDDFGTDKVLTPRQIEVASWQAEINQHELGAEIAATYPTPRRYLADPIPWSIWNASANLDIEVGPDDATIDQAVSHVSEMFYEVGVSDETVETTSGLVEIRCYMQSLTELVMMQSAIIESLTSFDCSLCGDTITEKMIDVDKTHACCGCGYRGRDNDKAGWKCPNCN